MEAYTTLAMCNHIMLCCEIVLDIEMLRDFQFRLFYSLEILLIMLGN